MRRGPLVPRGVATALVAVTVLLEPSCLPNGEPAGGTVVVDVVLDDAGLEIYLAPLDGSCACNWRFLTDGGCGETFSDMVGCSCGEGRTPATVEQMRSCIEELHAFDASGEELVAGDDIPGMVMFGGGATELVIVGCGATASVPLDRLPRPEPLALDDVRRTGPAAADAAANVAEATHAQVCTNTYFVEDCCDAPPGRVPVPTVSTRASGRTKLSAIAGPMEQQAPSGPVRVWRRAQREIGPVVVVPEPFPDGAPGEWSVELRRSSAQVMVVFEVDVDQLTFDPAAPDRLMLRGAASIVRLGPLEDTIDLDVGEGVHYQGTVTHDPVERRLMLGDIVDNEIRVGPVPLTLTRQGDPSETLAGTFEVQALLPAIARP